MTFDKSIGAARIRPNYFETMEHSLGLRIVIRDSYIKFDLFVSPFCSVCLICFICVVFILLFLLNLGVELRPFFRRRQYHLVRAIKDLVFQERSMHTYNESLEFDSSQQLPRFLYKVALHLGSHDGWGPFPAKLQMSQPISR